MLIVMVDEYLYVYATDRNSSTAHIKHITMNWYAFLYTIHHVISKEHFSVFKNLCINIIIYKLMELIFKPCKYSLRLLRFHLSNSSITLPLYLIHCVPTILSPFQKLVHFCFFHSLSFEWSSLARNLTTTASRAVQLFNTENIICTVYVDIW